ncbi:MAG: S-layer homology domain-containing protein [Methylocystaceae bacterium]
MATVQPAAAAEIKDLTACSDYARPSVERLAANGIISGDQNGYFKPHDTVTRGEMITIIVRALDIESNNSPATATFKDVPTAHWANKYVESAYARGIVKGLTTDYFGVDKNCTREEMAAMFVRAFKVFDDSGSTLALPTLDLNDYSDDQQVSAWAKDAMGFALYSGLLFGTSKTTISPQAAAVREQAAVLVDRFKNRYASIKADRQAGIWLNKAYNSLTAAPALAQHTASNTQFVMWQASADFPQEFSVNTDSNSEAIWPGLIHSITRMNMPGLPQNDYPPYSFEQYLDNNVVYEKVTEGDTTAGWEHYPALSPDETSQIMAAYKDNLTAILDPGLIAHQTGICTVATTTSNNKPVYQVSYTGNITDLESYLRDVLPALIPQEASSPDNWIDDIVSVYTSASYTQTYTIGADDGKLYGTSLQLQIDCRQSDNTEALPLKTMTIKAFTDNYLYDNIGIVLPDAAKNSPEKQNV